jgi:autotransporter translocation and assembly factor TamB
LKLTGDVRKPRLEGTVSVETASLDVARIIEETTANPYSIDEADAGLAGADEAARAVQPDAAEVREEVRDKVSQPSLFSALDLDVTLDVPDNMVLRGTGCGRRTHPLISVTSASRRRSAARVQSARREPSGCAAMSIPCAATTRSRAGASRSCATATFVSPAPTSFNPTLNIRARRIISGVETFVRVEGTLKQPELSFSSNPPLDQADILSLIVFNTPINELGEGQQLSLPNGRPRLAGGYLASGLTRSISNALQLDEFEIQAGEQGFGPTLSVGEQVGEHFFFRVKQGFGDAQATELILEYQLEDHLRVQGTAAQTSDTQRVTFRRVEARGPRFDLLLFVLITSQGLSHEGHEELATKVTKKHKEERNERL